MTPENRVCILVPPPIYGERVEKMHKTIRKIERIRDEASGTVYCKALKTK